MGPSTTLCSVRVSGGKCQVRSGKSWSVEVWNRPTSFIPMRYINVYFCIFSSISSHSRLFLTIAYDFKYSRIFLTIPDKWFISIGFQIILFNYRLFLANVVIYECSRLFGRTPTTHNDYTQSESFQDCLVVGCRESGCCLAGVGMLSVNQSG